MKKVWRIEGIDCANCAAKIEDGISRIKGVESVSLSFLAQKLKIEAAEEDFESIMKEAAKIIRKVEPDCTLIEK